MSGSDRLDAEGPAAPPRSNGELVFEAPWQSRVFAVTHSLCDAGVFTWDAFREHLIAEIGAYEGENPGGGSEYYACWLAALEAMLDQRGLCAADVLDAKAKELAARPAGHDHPHPHKH